MIRRVLDGLYLAAGWAAGFFLVAIFVLMMGLSIGRFQWIRFNIPAGDDFVAWCMAATAFLGLAYTFKSGEMIRVGLLVDRLQGRVRRIVELFSLVLGFGFSAYFAWFAIELVRFSIILNDVAQGVVAMPLWIPQLGFAGGLVLLAVAFADELIRVVAGYRPSYEKEPPKSAEEVIERAMSSAV